LEKKERGTGTIMARTNEYKSQGGSFDKLSDALSSIDELIQDVKRVGEEKEAVPEQQRSFRTVISELQNELGVCISALMSSWRELGYDPFYIYSTEEVTVKEYRRNIKFLHPEYEHVWLTEGNGKNVASELIPFIDFGLTYKYKKNKVFVSNLILDTKLNLPDFKTSLKAAHVDLEILKEDAKRVELVCENGEAAHKKLSETLTAYCGSHDVELEIQEESVPFAETPEERAQRLKKEAEVARKAEMEAKKKAEEEERAAKKKAEEEERAAKKKADREKKHARDRERKKGSSLSSSRMPHTASAPPPPPTSSSPGGRVSAPPIPPPFKK
jgi:hypothetical protein